MAAFAGVCLWTAWQTAHSAEVRLADQMNGVLRVLREASFPLSPHVLEQMKHLSGADFVLEDPSGVRQGTIEGTLHLPASMGEASSGEKRIWGDFVTLNGQRFWYRSVSLTPPSPQTGSQLYILYPESAMREAIWQAVKPTLTLSAAGGMAALALIVVATRGAVRHLRVLERCTARIADGDFRPVALPKRPWEIRQLAERINEMAAKLQQMKNVVVALERDRLLNQISGGLAHQLRNAATGARLAVQIHAAHCTHDPESLQVVERQLDRMESDLKRFLDWKRGDTRRDSCCLVKCVEEVHNLLGPRCRHTGTELKFVPPARSVRIVGDALQLTHMILNIVTNAVDAAGPGGRVQIEMFQDGAKVVMDVDDTGAGPPPEIQARLFEPFVTAKHGGVGLGLAYARQVARAHGGDIVWTRLEDHRTRFRIVLPVEKS
jgi:signal transduction histidine kinase